MLSSRGTRVPAFVPTTMKGAAQITKKPKKDLQDSVRLPEEDAGRRQVPSRAIGLNAKIDKKPEI